MKKNRALKQILDGHRVGLRLDAEIKELHKLGWVAFGATIGTQRRITMDYDEFNRLGVSAGDHLLVLAKPYPKEIER